MNTQPAISAGTARLGPRKKNAPKQPPSAEYVATRPERLAQLVREGFLTAEEAAGAVAATVAAATNERHGGLTE